MKKLRIYLVLVALLFAAVFVVAGCEDQAEGIGDFADGIHEGVSDVSDKGYVAATVRVEDGEIVEVEMREYRGDGTLKTPENYTFEPWIEAAERLPQAVIEAQSADVDIITEATGTSEKFMQAVRRALGEEKPYEYGDYQDGSYQAESDADDKGYVEIEVTILLGRIVNVEMTEYRGDGTAKTRENYDFEPWHTALDELPAAVIEKQSAEVDIVTEATGTSNKFMQAVERALEQAL